MADTPPLTGNHIPRPRRRVLVPLALAVAGLLAALAVAAWLRPDLAGAVLLRALARAGVRVEAESLDLRLFPPVLEAHALEVDAGPGLRLRARRLAAEAGPWLGLGPGPVLALLQAEGLEADLTLGGGAGAGPGESGNPLALLDRLGRVELSGAVLRLHAPGTDMDLSDLSLVLGAPVNADAGRDLDLHAAVSLDAGGDPLSGKLVGALAVGGRVLPGGSLTVELSLDGRLDRLPGGIEDAPLVTGGIVAHALAAWDGSTLDVSALDVSVTDFQAAPMAGVRAAGGRAWLQAGLRWEPGVPPTVVRAHVALEGAMFQVRTGLADRIGLSGGMDLEAELRSTDVWLGERLDMESCRVLLTDLVADLPDARVSVPMATVTARGGLDVAAMSLAVDRADLRLGRGGRLLEAVAGLHCGPGMSRWRADLAGRLPDSGRVLDLLRPLLPDSLRGLRLSGLLPVHAAWRSDDEAGFVVGARPKGLRLRWPGHGLSAMLEGQLAVGLPAHGEPTLSGALAVAGGGAAGPLEARRAVVRTGLSGTLARPALTGLRLDVPAGDLSFDGVVLPLGAVALRGGLKMAGGVLEAHGLALDFARQGRITGDLSLPLVGPQADPLAGTARLASKSLDLRAVCQVLQVMGLAPADLPRPEGSASLDFSLDQAAGPRATLQTELRAISLSTEDQSVMADGCHGAFTARADLSGARAWRAELALDRGQLLAGTVFMDFADNPLAMALGARPDGQGGLVDASGSLELGGLGVVDLPWGSLRREARGWSWTAHATARDLFLPGLLETFVRQPLAFSRPEMASLSARLRPDGDLTLDLSLAVSPGEAALPGLLDMAGRLTLHGADVDWPAKGVNAMGLDLDLPFAYTFGAQPLDRAAPLPSPPDDEARWGRLRCRALATPTGVLDNLDLGLALEPDGLFTRGEVAVPVLGGRLVLGQVRVADPLGADFRLQVPARLEDVDLSLLKPANVPLVGRLSGNLGLVRADRERLEAPGRLEGTLIEGRLSVTGLGMDRPLDQGRVVGIGRAEVKGLDLERLSAAMDVGRITGRMDVSLDHAAVAWGQPQRMDLRVESVEAPGVRQLVSLKAVNTISVIGTGSGLTDVGVGMFAAFFKEFRYEKIGIACALHNDVFRVRGLIHSGGLEYLIKKPLFFGINVVNQNPDNRISFSDMMERIGRVVGDTSGKGARPQE